MTAGRAAAVACGASLGGFLFGFDTSTVNAATAGMRASIGLSPGQVGFVVAIALIGCAIGAWFAGNLSARFGRTRVMLLAGTLMTAGSLGVAFGQAIVPIGIARLVTGLGIGAASAVVPAYIAEVSPKEIRGRLGSLWQLALVIGQLLGLLVGFGLTAWAGTEAAPMPWGGAAWRWMFGVVAAIAAIYAVLAYVLPPSPFDERGETRKVRVPLRLLLGSRFGLKPIVWTGLLLAMFQQLVGISVVKLYSNTVWQAVGLPTSAAFTVSIVTVCISVLSTFVAIALIDRIGRRKLLLVGAGLMAISLAVLAACFATATGTGTELTLARGPGIGALVAMNVFAVAFGISWGPVLWVILGELFDGGLRTVGVAVCTAVNWAMNWAVVRTFPTIAGVGLGFAYGFYAGFALLALLFVWRAVPETRGRTIR